MEALCKDLEKQGDVVSAHVNEMANLNTDVAMRQVIFFFDLLFFIVYLVFIHRYTFIICVDVFI